MISSMHHNSPSSPDAGFRFVEGWPPSRKKYDGSVRAHVLHKHFTLQRSRRRRKRSLQPGDDGDDDEGRQGQIILLPRPSIQDMQEASADPFHSFAAPIDGMEGYLLQQYIQHWWGGLKTSTKFQVPRDIFFAVNSSDPLTVDVMLAYGASSVANRFEDDNLQRTALARKTKVMHHLQKRIDAESGVAPSEGLFIGVGGAIATMTDIDQHYTQGLLQGSVFQIHLQGLRSLIAASGGWNVLKSKYPPVTYLIAWLDAQTRGLVLKDLTSPPSAIPGEISSFSTVEENLPPNAVELLHMYTIFYHAAKSRDYGARSGKCRSSLDIIWLFQPLTCVYPVLRTKSYKTVHRIIPLLLINLLLYQLQFLPQSERIKEYHSYRQSILDCDVTTYPATESVLFALLTDTQQRCIRDTLLFECAMRLIVAANELDPEMDDLLCENLCDFIVLFEEERLIGLDDWMTPEQLSEVLKTTELADETTFKGEVSDDTGEDLQQ